MSQDRFDDLVTVHHGEVFRYLLRVTGRGADADDLSQEVFLRAFKAFGALAEDANVRGWLLTIATNQARNHFRSEGRRKRSYEAVADAGSRESPRGPQDENVRREEREQVAAVIATLPSRQRLAFTLRKFHDLEYRDIGEMLKCSKDTARAHVFQAFRKIRRAVSRSEKNPAEARR